MSIEKGLQIEIQDEMQQVLKDFCSVLQTWTLDGTNKMIDPYETHYSENYAPANAAVIYASVYRSSGNRNDLDKCMSMIRRSQELLRQREGINTFCRVFLYHYSMMAMLLLPEEARDSSCSEFSRFYSSYVDDCPQLNTNCAALQWGIEIFLDSLGFRKAEPEKLDHLLEWVKKAQASNGFINDELTFRGELDGMPIAYHAFTLFILFSTVAVTDRWPGGLEHHKVNAQKLIDLGLNWLMHSVTEDGTFAMIERSSHQMFTWGAFAALLSGTNLAGSEVFRNAWRYWLRYRRSDGSYSCTTNWLPHELRVGFETYTHVNMYNNLGLTGIAVALKVLEKPERLQSAFSFLEVPQEEAYADLSSGYAFFRKGSHFFACTLRMHNRKYAPAMQGFHYRCGLLKLPLVEPKIKVQDSENKQFPLDGVWEGFLLTDLSGRYYYADSTENADVEFSENGICLVLETELFRCRKEIILEEHGFAWRYQLMLKRDFAGCRHVLPILLHDGRDGTKVIERSTNRMELHYQGNAYALVCSRSDKVGTLLNRSLLSVSGVATSAHINISGPYSAGSVLEWETTLNAINETEGVSDLKDNL